MSTDHGETPSISHLHEIIGDLADRVTKLEDHAHDRVEHVSSSPDSQPDSRMQQYLDSVGLTDEACPAAGTYWDCLPLPRAHIWDVVDIDQCIMSLNVAFSCD